MAGYAMALPLIIAAIELRFRGCRHAPYG